MFPIAGQTAGPIGLKFFVDTHGWPEGDIGLKNPKKTFQKFPRATPGPSCSISYKPPYRKINHFNQIQVSRVPV